MGTDIKFDIFLSHNSNDKDRVRVIAERLRSKGLSVWFDEWVIKPGSDIYYSIENGLEQSKTLILCMSNAAFSSDWVNLERNTILFRDPENKNRHFIPILLEECQIPDIIKRFKYIDFRFDLESPLNELIKVCSDFASNFPAKEEVNLSLKNKKKLVAKQKSNFKAHNHFVNTITITQDGKTIITGSQDNKIKFWDVNNLHCIKEIDIGYNNDIWASDISADGKVLSIGAKHGLYLFKLFSGKKFAHYRPHYAPIYDVSFLNLRPQIISASQDGSIKITSLNDGSRIRTFKGHEGAVNCLDISPNESYAVSGSNDNTMKLWDTKSGKCLRTFIGHSDSISDVHLIPNHPLVLSCSDDKSIKLWDLRSGKCTGTFVGHKASIHSLSVSTANSFFASAGFIDGEIRIWDYSSGAFIQALEAENKSSFVSVKFSPDGSHLICGTGISGNIYIYRITLDNKIPAYQKPQKFISAKVVLMGESGVGKTALAHRLSQDEYIIPDSTHGMNVFPIDFDFNDSKLIKKEILLWDLAGQDDYRLIHQLFIDETALALILFNPQSDNPFADVGKWIKALKMATKYFDDHQINKILVAARIDVGRVKISQKKIDKFLQNNYFRAYLPTSSKTGQNCSDRRNKKQPSELKKIIAKNIKWDSLPWISSNDRFQLIKQSILNISIIDNVHLIRISELLQRVKYIDSNIGLDELRRVLTLLSNQAIIITFKLGEFVLLKPELLSSYASAIIREARDHIDEIGCVEENAIIEKKFDFSNIVRLTPPDEDLLLRSIIHLLIEKNICIAEDTSSGKLLIFPSQYRKENKIKDYPATIVTYSFFGEIQTLYSTLVVRLWYGGEFDNKELWANAAEFSTSKGDTIGLMLEKDNEGNALIRIFCEPNISDELKIIFRGYVHNHLLKYAYNIKRQRQYVCECGKPVVDLDIAHKRLNRGIDYIICQDCDERIQLLDHIEQRLKTDPIAKKIIGWDHNADKRTDNQAMEQILLGQLLTICGEAEQIFRPVSMFDYGIDGEIEFKDDFGSPSGKKIYVQLKNGASYLDLRRNGSEVFRVKNARHLKYWISQVADVYLVIRDSKSKVRWMNITKYLKTRKDKSNQQIIFTGSTFNVKSIWRVRDKLLKFKNLATN